MHPSFYSTISTKIWYCIFPIYSRCSCSTPLLTVSNQHRQPSQVHALTEKEQSYLPEQFPPGVCRVMGENKHTQIAGIDGPIVSCYIAMAYMANAKDRFFVKGEFQWFSIDSLLIGGIWIYEDVYPLKIWNLWLLTHPNIWDFWIRGKSHPKITNANGPPRTTTNQVESFISICHLGGYLTNKFNSNIVAIIVPPTFITRPTITL